MTHLLQVTATILGYMLLIVGLWAMASLAVMLIWKSRPRLEPAERQEELYIHSMTDNH